MKKNELIHLQFGYEEALESKKDILNVEKSLLIISKTMKRYHELRREEIRQKKRLHTQVRSLLTLLRKLQKVSPKFDIPKKLQRHKAMHEDKESKLSRKENSIHESSVESELREIQEKLNALQKR